MPATNITLDEVRRALGQPRLGATAQARMSPQPRPGRQWSPPSEQPKREASVLLLLFKRDRELNFFLTRRTDTVATHKGQISLPGGGRAAGETLEETARREAREELGVDESRIELLGEPLTPLFIGVSDFWVTPFVGYYDGDPTVTLAQAEVVEVIRTPLASLLDDSIMMQEEWELRGMPVQVPYFLIGGHKVWGATAMILSEFKAMLAGVRSVS